MTVAPLHISSRDNPALAEVRRALRNPAAYRGKGGSRAAKLRAEPEARGLPVGGRAQDAQAHPIWLEGEHLLRACLARAWPLQQALVAASAWDSPVLRSLAAEAQRVLLLPDALFRELSALQSPAGIGALIEQPQAMPLRDAVPTVLLDRLQDAGNVGSILRCAAALGVSQVVALKGTAALWSPKVLRAAMGAHFALQLHEGQTLDDLQALRMPWVATSSHAPTLLHHSVLPQPCAWVFGHEGQGVADDVAAHCTMTLRIAQPGGEESLNVAAAAAICLHESLRQRDQ